MFAGFCRYIIYTLHSAMQSTDQRKIFRLPPPGVRKIVSIQKLKCFKQFPDLGVGKMTTNCCIVFVKILSTNLSETSVTINDCGVCH